MGFALTWAREYHCSQGRIGSRQVKMHRHSWSRWWLPLPCLLVLLTRGSDRDGYLPSPRHQTFFKPFQVNNGYSPQLYSSSYWFWGGSSVICGSRHTIFYPTLNFELSEDTATESLAVTSHIAPNTNSSITGSSLECGERKERNLENLLVSTIFCGDTKQKSSYWYLSSASCCPFWWLVVVWSNS